MSSTDESVEYFLLVSSCTELVTSEEEGTPVTVVARGGDDGGDEAVTALVMSR